MLDLCIFILFYLSFILTGTNFLIDIAGEHVKAVFPIQIVAEHEYICFPNLLPNWLSKTNSMITESDGGFQGLSTLRLNLFNYVASCNSYLFDPRGGGVVIMCLEKS